MNVVIWATAGVVDGAVTYGRRANLLCSTLAAALTVILGAASVRRLPK